MNFIFSPRNLVRMAGMNMLGLVAMGAYGGHNAAWEVRRRERFQIAQVYHIISSVGLYMAKSIATSWMRSVAGASFLIGLAAFVVPLYYMALTSDEKFPLRKAMPFGGVALMIGFAMFL